MRIQKSKIQNIQEFKSKTGFGISTKVLDFWILPEWCLLVESSATSEGTLLCSFG